MTAPRLTLIGGPTASGKSALALDLARRTGAVIVNADSQQLYADLRIVTARPSEAEEVLAEHRFYGIADAAEAWSVGRWARAVEPELARLREAGRPVVVVGGTGLYFHALTEGLAEIPPVDPEIRADIQSRFDTSGEDAFRDRLRLADPASERRIAPGDRQRLVRAAAVHAATGLSLSAWRSTTRPLLAEGTYRKVRVDRPRDDLYARCDARVEAMMTDGALAEVAALLARRLDDDLPAMKALGVPELRAVLERDQPLAVAAANLKRSTRQYAKRQLTWFRNQWRDTPPLASAATM